MKSEASKLLDKFKSEDSDSSKYKTFGSEDSWRRALPKSSGSTELEIENVFGKLIAKYDGENIGSYDPRTSSGKILTDHLKKSKLDELKSSEDSEDAGEKLTNSLMDDLSK